MTVSTRNPVASHRFSAERCRIALSALAAALIFCIPPAALALDKTVLKSQEATSALLRGRFDLAIAVYDEALKDQGLPASRQANLYSDRGAARWRLKQLDGALSDLNKALALNADYAPAYNNRGNVLMDLNRPEDALKDFQKAVALAPGMGAAFSNRANANQKLKRMQEADDDYRKALEIMPQSAVPFNGRGKLASAQGRHYTALRYLNRAVALNAQYTAAYGNRGMILTRLQRFDDAIADFDKVIALVPDSAEFYVRRGYAYSHDKRYTFQAIRDFGRAIDLQPDNVEALCGRAAQNIERKRYDLAAIDINQALTADPQSPQAYLFRGQVRKAASDVPNAEADMTRAIELDASYSEAYRARGEIRDASGNKEAAIADYRRALELDPFSLEARDAYKGATGDTFDTVVKPVAKSMAGWDIFSPAPGRYVALNERYPKLPVLMEMQGDGIAEILEWTPLKDWLSGIGLLRYKAGEKKGAVFENVAILDLNRSLVVAIEPYVAGDAKSKWVWTQNAVTVTDPDGVASAYELRKAKPVETARASNDDPFDFFSEPRRGRGRRSSGGVFGWLFN